MSTNKVVRVAVIGVGGMATQHARLLHEHGRARLVCVCDIVRERAENVARELDCEALTDAEKLLARNDVDAVLIGVPNGLHHAIALEAVRAGKHTAVEYPVCQTVAEYDMLAAEAAARDLVLADLLTPLIEPQPLTIKRLKPKIGTIMSMQSAYYAGASTSWYVNRAVRGSFFAALTIHQIVYFNVVLDATPDWVSAALYTRSLDTGRTWATGMFMGHYPDGVLAHNDWGMGFDASPNTWYWILEGTEGRLVYERPAGAPHRARWIRRGHEDELFPIAPQAGVHGPAIDNFLAQILDGEAPFAPPAKSREILRICEAAEASAAEGKRIAL